MSNHQDISSGWSELQYLLVTVNRMLRAAVNFLPLKVTSTMQV